MLTRTPATVRLGPAVGCPLPSTDALFAPGLAARAIARLRRPALDRALSDGRSPTASPLLAATARRLNRPRTRMQIAQGLERLALASEQPSSRARVVPPRGALRANRTALLELAARLRRDVHLYVRGIAMLELVLIDGTGPAYVDHRGEALARELELARAALEC